MGPLILKCYTWNQSGTSNDPEQILILTHGDNGCNPFKHRGQTNQSKQPCILNIYCQELLSQVVFFHLAPTLVCIVFTPEESAVRHYEQHRGQHTMDLFIKTV